MIKLNSNKNVWITSDTHYGHTNICRGVTNWRMPDGSIPESQTRDFPNVEVMNSTIVNNINSLVDHDDILIHLGDWSFGGFENIEKFRERLNVREIHLILGNHDHHIDRNRGNCQSLFSSVNWFQQIEYMGHTLECMHYPITSWNNLRKGRIHLHGHCHLPSHLKISGGRRIDVGLDGSDGFQPYDLGLLINDMKQIPIGSELGSLDHHNDDMKNVVG